MFHYKMESPSSQRDADIAVESGQPSSSPELRRLQVKLDLMVAVSEVSFKRPFKKDRSHLEKA